MSSIILKSLMCRGLNTTYLVGQPKQNPKGILFFIHGCPDDHEVWRSCMDKLLQEEFIVVAPNLRGILGSVPPKDGDTIRYSTDSIVMDHLEVLAQFNKELPVSVICHDIGSVSGWELARRLGTRLSRLVAINSPDPMTLLGQFRKLSQIKKSWYIGFFQLGPLAKLYLEKKKKKIIRFTFKQGLMPDIDDKKVEHAAELLTCFLPHYQSAFRELTKKILADHEIIKKPLIIWGNKDAFLNVPTAWDLKSVASFPEIRVLEGGHWIFKEKEDDVVRLIGKGVC